MKKHYLFLMSTRQLGGAELLLMDYFKFINYEKYSVTWSVNQDIFSPYLKKDSLPVKVMQLPKFNKEGIVKKYIKFYKYLQEIKPDYIVFNQFLLRSFSLPELIAGYIITKGKVFMIVHDCAPPRITYKSRLHFGIIPGFGIEWRRERLFQKLLVYFTKNTIAVSKATKEFLLKFHKFPQQKIKITYHGVDVNKFTPSFENRCSLRRHLNIPNSDTIIISTSRLDRIKRLERLIESFGILAQQRKGLWLIFIGTGQEYNSLSSMVQSFNEDVRRRVKFLGYREDVAPILAACDIYVLPSDSEGFPLACLEAMSCGLISIVTNSGGQREIIKDGWNGFLVEKSMQEILDGLNKVLNLDNEQKSRISSNARSSIVANFNLQERVKYALSLLGINNES